VGHASPGDEIQIGMLSPEQLKELQKIFDRSIGA
jgi:hypothetical protein